MYNRNIDLKIIYKCTSDFSDRYRYIYIYNMSISLGIHDCLSLIGIYSAYSHPPICRHLFPSQSSSSSSAHSPHPSLQIHSLIASYISISPPNAPSYSLISSPSSHSVSHPVITSVHLFSLSPRRHPLQIVLNYPPVSHPLSPSHPRRLPTPLIAQS